MKIKLPLYRKNHPLIFIFIGMLSFLLLAGLYSEYSNTKRIVDALFKLEKSDVYDATMAGYNRLINDSIPTISSSNENFDSVSFYRLSQRYFKKFPFIEDIVFYKLDLSNHADVSSIRVQNLRFKFISIIRYCSTQPGPVELYRRTSLRPIPPPILISRCHEPIYNFVDLINDFDSNSNLSGKDVATKLFRVSTRSLSYMNVPEKRELKLYRKLMFTDESQNSVAAAKNLIFFDLNPSKLRIINAHPWLYEKIGISSSPTLNSHNRKTCISTQLALPKAFAEYHLNLSSSRKFLKTIIIRTFIPNASILIVIYLITILIAYLIFRNLNINSIIFKLQYNFINNFTHEFKTPVSVIKIIGSNIKNGEFISNSELLHYGNIIDIESDKLDNLMNRLLSFTQLENRAVPLKKELVNMQIFCSDIVQAYRLTHPDFIIICNLATGIYFNTDKILLHSVFTNLADNAYRYSNPGKKELTIVVKKTNYYLHIAFIDKGIGIPNEELKHIFTKFYKIENEFNQQGSVGIGLAFCKEVIHYLRGDIIVSSVLGKGTTFYIKLPILD